MSTIEAQVEDLLHEAYAKAKSIGHHITDELHQLLGRLHGTAATLQQDAEADGEKLLHDAEAAAAPVVAEATATAEQLAGEAVADVESAVQPPASA